MKEFKQKLGEADLNINAPNEVFYRNGVLIKQDIDLFVQEIQFLLDTEKGDILGSDFGTTAKQIIWRQSVNEKVVENILTKEIRQYCDMSNRYDFTLTVRFLKGQIRDIAVIDIDIKEVNTASELPLTRTLRYTFD